MSAKDVPISVVTAKIYRDLVQIFGEYPVSELGHVVDGVENFLTGVLRTQIIARADSFLDDAHEAEDGDHFTCGTTVVKVEMTDNAASRRTLELALLFGHFVHRKPRMITKVYSHEGFGRYTKFRVSWPVELNVRWEHLSQLIQTIVRTVYQWLENFVENRLITVETELSQSLYLYARTTFHCGEHLKKFWFVAVKDGKGYCLFDHRSAQDVISIASKVTQDTDLTPSGIAVNFIVSEADFDLMIAKDAITQGQCLDVPFEKTKYKSMDLDFSEAEAAIHQADSITLYPLVREGKGFLLAGFPTPSKGVFEPLLREHEAEIVSIFKSQLESLKKLRSMLRKTVHADHGGTIGKIIGGIIRIVYIDP